VVSVYQCRGQPWILRPQACRLIATNVFIASVGWKAVWRPVKTVRAVWHNGTNAFGASAFGRHKINRSPLQSLP
jgi:hypothetical protein